MGRRNRRRPYEPSAPRALGHRSVEGSPSAGGPGRSGGYGPAGDWVVQRVGGAPKAYRCPGCDQEVPAGVPHVVAWPVEALAGLGGPADRRHWHSPCWAARSRRRPTPRHLR